MTLHMYANDVTDYFAAESLDDAKLVARAWYVEQGLGDDDISECSEDLRAIPDDKVLTYTGEDGAETPVRKTAAEFASENGKGFWATTEI